MAVTELKPNLQPLTKRHNFSEPRLEAQAAVAEASRVISDAQKSNTNGFRLPAAAEEQHESKPRLLSVPEWLVEMAMRPETPWYERMALLGALAAY